MLIKAHALTAINVLQKTASVSEEKIQPNKTLPEKVNIVDKNRSIITSFTILSKQNQQDLYYFRINFGIDVIKKRVFEPVYEIAQDWLMQINQTNPNGILQLAKMFGVSEDAFRLQASITKDAPLSTHEQMRR